MDAGCDQLMKDHSCNYFNNLKRRGAGLASVAVSACVCEVLVVGGQRHPVCWTVSVWGGTRYAGQSVCGGSPGMLDS